MPATYEPIATTTLGSAAASITFSSIPSTYTDLRLVVVETNGTQLEIQFNNDTATNYSNTRLYGFGATAASNRDTSATAIGGFGGTSSPNWSLFTWDVFSYAGSTYKTALSTFSADANGSGGVGTIVGLWRSTAAINSIKILAGGTFAIGTTATLYGIKAA